MSLHAQFAQSTRVHAHSVGYIGELPVYDSVWHLTTNVGVVANIWNMGPSTPHFLVDISHHPGQLYDVLETRGRTHDDYRSSSVPYQGRYFFPFFINGAMGINAQAAYDNERMERINYADCLILAEMMGSRPSIRIQIKNREPYSHQFYVKCRGHEPITLRELATRVAQEVKRYLHGRHFRVNSTPMNDIVLLGVTKVSNGSIQPELALIQ